MATELSELTNLLKTQNRNNNSNFKSLENVIENSFSRISNSLSSIRTIEEQQLTLIKDTASKEMMEEQLIEKDIAKGDREIIDSLKEIHLILLEQFDFDKETENKRRLSEHVQKDYQEKETASKVDMGGVEGLLKKLIDNTEEISSSSPEGLGGVIVEGLSTFFMTKFLPMLGGAIGIAGLMTLLTKIDTSILGTTEAIVDMGKFLFGKVFGDDDVPSPTRPMTPEEFEQERIPKQFGGESVRKVGQAPDKQPMSQEKFEKIQPSKIKDKLSISGKSSSVADYLEETNASNTQKSMGISKEQYDVFRGSIAKIESPSYSKKGGSSNRFSGAYQMGADEIKESAKALGITPPSREEFLNNPQLQERLFDKYTEGHHKQLMKNKDYASKTPEEQLKILGYAHNQGAGGAAKWIKSGVVGKDAFGTAGTKYYESIGKNLSSLEKGEVKIDYGNEQTPVQTASKDTSQQNIGQETSKITSVDVGTKKLLDTITTGEGTSDEKAKKLGFESGYDVPYGFGKYVQPDKPLSQMTVGEVKEYQKNLIQETKGKVPGTEKGTGAVGKYQVVGETLKAQQKALGFKDTDIFDADLQDKIGQNLLKGRGYDKFRSGKMSEEDFQRELAKEWASIADPSTGKSRYGQGTGTSSEKIKESVQFAKENKGEQTDIKVAEALSKEKAKESPENKTYTKLEKELPEGDEYKEEESELEEIDEPILKEDQLTTQKMQLSGISTSGFGQQNPLGGIQGALGSLGSVVGMGQNIGNMGGIQGMMGQQSPMLSGIGDNISSFFGGDSDSKYSSIKEPIINEKYLNQDISKTDYASLIPSPSTDGFSLEGMSKDVETGKEEIMTPSGSNEPVVVNAGGGGAGGSGGGGNSQSNPSSSGVMGIDVGVRNEEATLLRAQYGSVRIV